MVKLIGFSKEMGVEIKKQIDDIIGVCDSLGKTPFNFKFKGVRYRSTLIIDNSGYRIVFDGRQFMG